MRPPYGVVVLGEGERVEVENTEELRSEVLAMAEKIREHRRNIARGNPGAATGARSAERAASGKTALKLALDVRTLMHGVAGRIIGDCASSSFRRSSRES